MKLRKVNEMNGDTLRVTEEEEERVMFNTLCLNPSFAGYWVHGLHWPVEKTLEKIRSNEQRSVAEARAQRERERGINRN